MIPDLALLVLVRAGIGGARLRALLDHHRDAEAALQAARDGGGLSLDPAERAALRSPDESRLHADLEWLGPATRRLVAWHDPDYPPLLRHAPSPPAVLFVDGDPLLAWHPQIAIVGSRRPTLAGRDRAFRFAQAFAAAGWVVTSGLAAGIDAAAHEGALAAGRTLAVVGTGPDVAYPAGNVALQSRIAAHGAVVSEHPPGTGPRPEHFPSRNRIVAGLSLGTLVVEAAIRSGALISARLAADAGRDVFAIPGAPENPMARGCHRLLREGATLVEEPADVVRPLAAVAASLAGSLRGRLHALPDGPAGHSARGQADDDPDHSLLWSALGSDPIPLDVIAGRTGLTVPALSSMLLHMELDGRVVADNGRYARRRS